MKIVDVEIYPDGRMDTENTSLYLGLASKTLAMLRCNGKGPKFTKRGKIFYFKNDLDQWIAEGSGFNSTAQARFCN
jgi:hypothetical protein